MKSGFPVPLRENETDPLLSSGVKFFPVRVTPDSMLRKATPLPPVSTLPQAPKPRANPIPSSSVKTHFFRPEPQRTLPPVSAVPEEMRRPIAQFKQERAVGGGVNVDALAEGVLTSMLLIGFARR